MLELCVQSRDKSRATQSKKEGRCVKDAWGKQEKWAYLNLRCSKNAESTPWETMRPHSIIDDNASLSRVASESIHGSGRTVYFHHCYD
jgi:hypothetical protein